VSVCVCVCVCVRVCVEAGGNGRRGGLVGEAKRIILSRLGVRVGIKEVEIA
jgi:hypothetical protein